MLRVPLSEPLFLLGVLFICVVFFVPGGLASLAEPALRAACAARRRAARGRGGGAREQIAWERQGAGDRRCS